MEGHNYRGILFDFDGVLALTGPDNFRAWQRALSDYDKKIIENDYYQLEGKKSLEIAEEYCIHHNLNKNLAPLLVKQKEKYYFQKDTRKEVIFYAGVEELINTLFSCHIPVAVVTAACYDRIIQSVPESFFKKINKWVTGDLNMRGKPFPDLYLEGTKALGLQSQECIAVENSPFGIRSAKSAGIYCIAITSTLEKEKLSEADQVVAAFSDLQYITDIMRLLHL